MSNDLVKPEPEHWFRRVLKKVMSEETIGRAIDVGEAIGGQFPILGAFTGYAANEGRRFLGKRAERRVHEEMKKLDEQVSALGIKIDEDYITRDEFLDMWMAVAELFAKTTRESKLDAIRAVALNNLANADPNSFEEIDEPLLKLIDNLPARYVRVFMQFPKNDSIDNFQKFAASIGEDESLVNAAINNLHALGVVNKNSGPFQSARLSPWGRQMGERLMEPRTAGGVNVSGNVRAGDGVRGDGGPVEIEGGTGYNGANGGPVNIGPGEYRAGDGKDGGKGGPLRIKGGDAK